MPCSTRRITSCGSASASLPASTQPALPPSDEGALACSLDRLVHGGRQTSGDDDVHLVEVLGQFVVDRHGLSRCTRGSGKRSLRAGASATSTGSRCHYYTRGMRVLLAHAHATGAESVTQVPQGARRRSLSDTGRLLRRWRKGAQPVLALQPTQSRRRTPSPTHTIHTLRRARS